ncbi:ATP-dependent RNA helicase HrpA [Glutamicibacter mishrai]|uniref:ATP-dependent RNA helicase HrpA n=1 Tax=Glutamicibacter mishrai TaxID=1775880 RepID=UPI0020CCE686|nr:ATP-dependent RNA helicase HrpA [Glutamicibacter mishrai]UTT40935.1 ATP-dependent RNA helicase HrpA [Glutamicibacter mishrai]
MALSITYPEALPVSARRADILKAVRENQVVVIAGETGSGKTTQLPKMLIELGLAEKGMIGHTQPRRLAARTVAERIAEEMGTEIGDEVGFHVRFTGEVSRNTKLKVMTDGILLAEIQRDRLLKKYSAIIIDEAHERSLNIDFLLGYLKQIMPKRPELKIIITSATIDPERFAAHFGTPLPDGEVKPAPIIEVSGRTFPVELRYRPLQAEAELDADDENTLEEERDPLDAVTDAVKELSREAPGDILIFFSGEREIRDAAEALRALVTSNKRMPRYEVLPLFARLSLAEQHRVFHPGGAPRIILATNVAETSLTVPGIKYVIDTGTARISRYSHRTKVQRLPIERVSQASANQRSGRCGRVSEGIAIRLYSEDDFQARPEFTDPEILRTNLASVILQMISMGVVSSAAEVAQFPFVQPPEARAITDGVNLLRELGALGSSKAAKITDIGRKLAQLPLDVRLGRMIVESAQRGVAKEVMVLAAGLSIQDPRERPSEETGQRDRAVELHKRFADEKSDFIALLNLWAYLQEQQKELSSSAFRRLCKSEFINYLRVREWQDLFTQLRQLAKPLGITVAAAPVDPAANEDAVHISLLAGLLGHIGLYDERKRDYLGARGTRFAIFPGSGLFKKSPTWVMSAELVETSRLWARVNAAISPEWVEEVAPHLLMRTHSEPHWSKRTGSVMGYEKVTLFGLPIIPRRQFHYWRVDPQLARELFIRHALVEGDWRTHHKFFAKNRALLEEVEELETRMRRHDLRISDEELFAFYDARVGEQVYSERHFDRWWKKARATDPALLDFDPDALLAEGGQLDESLFPTTWQLGSIHLPLSYEYNPAASGAEGDGVSLSVPVVFLNQLDPARFAWLIPGLRHELITALIRSMPKSIRKNFVPAPDVAAKALDMLTADFDPTADDLAESLALVLRRLRGMVVDPAVFDFATLPAHLRFGFTVTDASGKVLGQGDDLAALQHEFAAANRAALASGVNSPGAGKPAAGGKAVPAAKTRKKAEAAGAWDQKGLDSWPQLPATGETLGDTLPAKVTTTVMGQQITAYPGLNDNGSTVDLTVFRNELERDAAHRSGVIRLLMLRLPPAAKFVISHLNNAEKLVFTQNPHGSIDKLIADCTMAAVDQLVPERLPMNRAGFEALFETVRAEQIDTIFTITAIVAKVFGASTRINKDLKNTKSLAMFAAVTDIRSQLEQLIYPGFIAATGAANLMRLPRYVQGVEKRLEKLRGGAVTRDSQALLVIQKLEDEYDAALERVPDGAHVPAALAQVKWMLEEMRISLFAQELGTAYSVSEKRIRKAIKDGLAQL